MKFGLKDRDIDNICDAVSRFPEVEKVKVFGSRVMGNYKKGSDMDLAIFGEKLNDNIAIKLAGILNEELPIPYFVDVLNYKTISNKVLIEHIYKFGKKIC